MILMHMIVILSSVWGNNGNIPQAPTEGGAIVMHYGNPGKSQIGAHKGYGFKLNHGAAEPLPVAKAW